MKDKLKIIENQLQSFIERHSEKIIGEENAERKLIHDLVQAMENKIRVHSKIGLVAPNNFILNVHEADVRDIRENQYLLDELAAQLMISGESAGLIFGGRITINVFPNDTLEKGNFELIASWKESELSDTVKIDSDTLSNKKSTLPPKAFLIVGGSKIYSLEQEATTIGRKLTNDLVIDDPKVSREHSHIKVRNGQHFIIDLDSSGGTFINGKKINQENLRPGDVISLAGVPLVYGQDAIRAVTDSQEYHPPSESSVDVTSEDKLSDLDLETFED